MRLTAEADAQAKRSLGSGRCFGPRLTYMLQAIQQFVALGDVLVGGSQSLVACGLWSIVRITILAATLSASSMERLSLLFMTAGRSAPRYQGLALLYARSRLIRDYLADHKSTISQIISSLNESKIRNAEEELNRWSQLIKDEANFLLAQTTEHEAIENNNFRRWLGRSTKSSSHQQNMNKRLQWLTAFSTFDYETPWKQARKRGSSSSFVDIPSYKQWKQKEGPHSLLLSGKMGCGKSVVMANMVDDLTMSCPEDMVIYFFCRHDIPESLSARTVFGSFAAQISQRHIGTDVLDEIFMNSVPSLMNLDRVLEIIPTMIKQIKGVRLLLDGTDECPEEEFDLIQTGLLKLSAECSILSCVSYRDQADGLQAKIWSAGQGAIMSIPDHNPDIAEFIEAELQRLMQSGKLSVGDPSLLIIIREALLQGAGGMFLWVALQIDTICAERTDHLIRRALDNLPKSLSGTFRRILERSKQEGRRCYQRDILKILVGAKRPLTVAEFREALSITPGDISWDPRKVINNIHSALACCGSLVIIDEDEGTVRLLHQSVVQFLQAAGPDSIEWSFTAQDADTHLGQITVTYLNYGVFDKRVSTRVIPQVNAGGAAGTIVTQSLRPLGTIGRKLSDTVMKRQKPSNRNIGRTLFKIQASEPALEDFMFLEYSSENFLSHTSRMSHASFTTLRLFRRLLLNHPQYTSWLENVHSSVESASFSRPLPLTALGKLSDRPPQILYQPDIAPNMSPQLQWAILHSHFLAFSMGLHDKLGLKTLLSIIRYLNHLMVTGRQLKLASHMCDKLLQITTLFRCNKPTNWLITTHGYSLEKYLGLLRSSDLYDYPTFRWAVIRDCFEDLSNVILATMTDLDVFRYSDSDLDEFLTNLFCAVNPRVIFHHACEGGDQSLVELILTGHLEMSTYNCNELLCKPVYGRFYDLTEIFSLLSMNVLFYNQSYVSAVRHAVHLKDWRSALEISRSLLVSKWGISNRLDACTDARDGDVLETVHNILISSMRAPGMPESWNDIVHRYPLFSLMVSNWDTLEDCCEAAKFSTYVQQNCRPLFHEDKSEWLIQGTNELFLSFFQHVLQYLIDQGPISAAHLFVSSTDLQASVLFYLNTLLEDFSPSFTSKTDWLDLARMVLQRYRLMTSHLTNFHDNPSPKEILKVNNIHILRSSFMRIAETLLRRRHPVLDGSDDWCVMIQYCFEGWYPDALMETTLQAYGFQQTLANLAGAYRTLAVRNTMPLSWEALAAGPKVFQVFKDQGTILDQLHAADLCLSSQLDFSEEIRSSRTVKAWRAGYSEWFSVGNRVEPFEHPFG
ncbi:hypothetical protein G7054_g11317 [Neopestalotiopsis clavispora]|nr:hypothetical protein G7054_g11317 [Neopestalotiopsis clavispora]